MATHSRADYEDAMSIADGSFTHPESVEHASSAAAGLAGFRFNFYENPEYLEEAIYRLRIYLKMMSAENPYRQQMTRDLEGFEEARFDGFYVASNSRATDAGETEVINRPSPSPPHLVSPLPITRSGIGEVTPTTQDVEDPHVLETIKRLCALPINRATIEEAMECRRRYLESPQLGDLLTSAIDVRLARLLVHAFEDTDDIAYLNESITLLRDVLKSPVTSLARLNVIEHLLLALFR